MLNTAFAPRSPCQPRFQPYSKSPFLALTVSRIILVNASSTIQTKSKGARIVLKPLHSGQKQSLQAFFENRAGNAANWLKILCRKWSIKEFCADRKQARNFCAGNAFPMQTKLYSLEYPDINTLPALWYNPFAPILYLL